MTREDFRKQMFACLTACRGFVPVVSNGVEFRCKPAADGGVILYKAKSRQQYAWFATWDAWTEWATSVSA